MITLGIYAFYRKIFALSTNNEVVEILESAQAEDRSKVDVLQFASLAGSADVRTVEDLFYANQSGMRLKMFRIILKSSKAQVKPTVIVKAIIVVSQTVCQVESVVKKD